MLAKLNMRSVSGMLIVLYAIELLDELIYGLQGAVLPLIKDELALSYTELGVLLTTPGVVALILEPLIGALGDTRYRRALVVGGICATTFGLALVAFGQTFAMILTAFVILYVASGAYVNLAQATLIDLNPKRSEQTMARWTLLGSVGVTIAPILVTIVLTLGYGWRGLYLAFAGAAGTYIALIWRVKFDAHAGAEDDHFDLWELIRDLFAAFRNADLWRWILLTELADLMLDKLYEVTGLYFADVVGLNFAEAAFASATYTVVGLIGSIALVPLLEKVNGLRILRWSAVLVAMMYALFLIVPNVPLKYVLIGALSFTTAGWFPILRGRTYAALPGQTGMVVAVTAFANFSSLFVPLLLGSIADAFGLRIAMWLLILGPLALIVGLPRKVTAQ